MPSAPLTRPIDATLSVTKAARLLGVHPNTVRAWSDAGRLRYYRINPRGDRRYRLGDLQRFLAAAENAPARQRLRRRHPDRRPAGRRDRRRRRPERSTAGPIPTDRERLRRRADLATDRRPDPDRRRPRDARRGPPPGRASSSASAAASGPSTDPRGPRRAARPPRDDRVGVRPRCPSCRGRSARWAPPSTGPPSADPGPGRPATGSAASATASAGSARSRSRSPATTTPWGVLTIVADPDGDQTAIDPDLLIELAAAIGRRSSRPPVRTDEVAHRLHRADALRRVAGDIGSRLDLDRILAGLVDHAMVLFNGDRAAVFLRAPRRPGDGRGQPRPLGPLPRVRRRLPDPVAARRSRSPHAGRCTRPTTATTRAAATSAPPSSRKASTRSARRRCSTRTSSLGLLNVYHDTPHDWTTDELDTMAALAEQAAVAIKNAQNYEQMATWAAQLQSIQQLGARLDAARRRARDRHRHRDRAAPADRLPQRPRLPRSTATT